MMGVKARVFQPMVNITLNDLVPDDHFYRHNEALPDHSSLTRIRDRCGVTIFRRFFEVIVERCQEDGLI